jgi:hypothetical protein
MKKTLFLVSLVFMLSGCVAYYPQLVDVPLINHKNDLRVDAGVSIIPTARATVSYGVSDKIAVQASANFQTDDVYYLQGAAGLYKKNDNLVKEAYVGVGYGLANAYKDANPGNLVGDYQVYFMQFNYGKINGHFAHADYGIGLKAGYLRSNLLDDDYYDIYYNNPNHQYEIIKDDNLLIEPTAFVRFGGERLKFNIKLGTCLLYKFTNHQYDNLLPQAFLNLGVGFSYQL